MARFPRFGFHNSGPGIGDHWRALAAAGFPIFFKSADSYGPCGESLGIALQHGVKHHIIYRLSTVGQNTGYDFDVPDYARSPEDAATVHWNATRNRIVARTPEFDKRVWIETCNEVRAKNNPGDVMFNNMHAVDWMGRFNKRMAQLANAEGYRVCAPGYSSGEPEPTDWALPGSLEYLLYCAANKEMASISLHEYNYGLVPTAQNRPWHWGRVQFLIDTCDAHGIARPHIHLTEWGWALNKIPDVDTAINQIKEMGSIYARWDAVTFAAIWWLGPGFGDIAKQVQRLIAPLTTTIQGTTYPDPLPPPSSQPAQDCQCGESIDARSWPWSNNASTIAGCASEGNVPIGLGWSGSLARPVDTTEISAGRDWRKPEGHTGIDYKTAVGDPVYAADKGLVIWSGFSVWGGGESIVLAHGRGYRTLYYHLSAVSVKCGDTVLKRQRIGTAGQSGAATFPHTHFEVRCQDRACSPYQWLDKDTDMPEHIFSVPTGAQNVKVTVTWDDPAPPTQPPTTPPTTLAAVNWPTTIRTVTQLFGDRPDYYGQFGLPGHEGIDIATPLGTKLVAVAAGTVTEAKGGTTAATEPYGRRVRIKTGVFEHLYAHMDSVSVTVGQAVTAGQQIGLSGNTGNSTGPHLHFGIKKDGANAAGETPYPGNHIPPESALFPLTTTLAGFVWKEGMREHVSKFGHFALTNTSKNLRAQASGSAQILGTVPSGRVVKVTGPEQAGYYPVLAPLTGAVPPTTQTHDLLEFMRGAHNQQYDLAHNIGAGGTQTHMPSHLADNRWRLIKGGNGDYEALGLVGDEIWRWEDTSRENHQGQKAYYEHLLSGVRGAPWVRRHMSVGQSVTFNKQVVHKIQATCAPFQGPANISDTIKLDAYHANYVDPISGIALGQTVELLWMDGGERYWFSKGWGLTGWLHSNQTTRFWFKAGPLTGRTPLLAKVPTCL